MRQVIAVMVVVLLAAPAMSQTAPPGSPQAAPPERIGPIWDSRRHQPNPAEIEARERARGVPPRDATETRDLDRLYRDLTGSDPQAPPRATSRDGDRR